MAKTPRKSTAPADESKRAKFLRLVNSRAKVAIKALRSIGKLSTAAYESTPDDIAKLTKKLGEEIDAMKARFSRTGTGKAEIEDIL